MSSAVQLEGWSACVQITAGLQCNFSHSCTLATLTTALKKMECGAGSGCSAIVCNPEYNCRALSAMLVQEAAEVQGWPPTLHQWGVEGGLGKRVLHQKVHQNQWRVEAYKRQRHQHQHHPPSRVVTQKDIDTRLLFQKLVSHKAAPRQARKRDNIGDQKYFRFKISKLSRFSGYWRYPSIISTFPRHSSDKKFFSILNLRNPDTSLSSVKFRTRKAH